MIGNILRAEIKNRNQVLKKCILLLAVMYAVVTMFLIAEESILQHELRETYDRYGEWTAVILDGNEELAASLEDDYPEVRFGRLAVLADVFYNDECIGRLGMADDVMVELGHPHLMEGRWPENDSQIVVTEHLLSGQGQKAATGGCAGVVLLSGRYRFLYHGEIYRGGNYGAMGGRMERGSFVFSSDSSGKGRERASGGNSAGIFHLSG